MSTLDKLKKVALTGHSVTLAPQSIIDIADLLGEVRDAYSEAHKSAEFWRKIAEDQKGMVANLNDGWSKAITERDNARSALANFESGFVECIRHKDRLAEELTSLLADVDAINNALGDHEWAEHCTTTQQGQTLEGFITALVGEVTELREKVKQSGAPFVVKLPGVKWNFADDKGPYYDCDEIEAAIKAAGGSVEE